MDKTLKKGGCELKTIQNSCYDAHGRQTYCALIAFNIEEWMIGRLNYSLYNNEVYVDMIEVVDDCRRKGIATKMMKELEKIYKKQKINMGFSTRDGSKFIRAYKKIGGNQ